jgi:hypothetical protein
VETARSCACLSLFKYKNPAGTKPVGLKETGSQMLSDQNRSANKALPYLNCGRAVKEHCFNVRLVPLLIRGQDRWYAVPVTGVREGNYMLLFYCAHCAKMVTADDDESLNQIVDWLDEHITKCPLATFTYEGTTNVARQRIGGLRSFLEDERLSGKIRLH